MASRSAHHSRLAPPPVAHPTVVSAGRGGDPAAVTLWGLRHRERINCWLLGAAIGGSAAILLPAAFAAAVWAARALGLV